MVEPGEYIHWKGGRYRVLGEVVAHDNSNSRFVLYTPTVKVEDEQDTYYMRTEAEFLEEVDVPTPRFRRVGD